MQSERFGLIYHSNQLLPAQVARLCSLTGAFDLQQLQGCDYHFPEVWIVWLMSLCGFNKEVRI